MSFCWEHLKALLNRRFTGANPLLLRIVSGVEGLEATTISVKAQAQ